MCFKGGLKMQLHKKGEHENERQNIFVPFSGPFSLFDYVISNFSSYNLRDIDKAYAYFYVYKFKNELPDRNSMEKEYIISKEEVSTNPSIDISLKYGIYSFIKTNFENNNEIFAETVKNFKKMRFYLDIKGHSSYVLPENLAFVLGLLTSNTSLGGVSNDEIYKKVLNITSKENIDEIIFRLNYYLALMITGKKFDSNNAKLIGNKLVSSGNVSSLEKIVALPFIESPENYYSEIVTAFINPEFYYNLFNLSLEMENSDYVQMNPIKIVNFLMVSKLLNWDKLSIVNPGLLRQAEVLKNYKEPITLEKSYLNKKNRKIIFLTATVSALASIFIFGLLTNQYIASLIGGVISLFLGLLDRKDFKIIPEDDEK